jgi:hypothetical protein
MRFPIAAALALAALSLAPEPAVAQAAPAIADMSYATPLPGTWSWSQTAGGSEVTFADASARPQLTIRCTRLSRFVTISRPASAAAAPSLSVWTGTLKRNLPAKFDPATARLSADLTPFDPLLDAIAFSRGRFAIGIAGQPPLVVPAWADVARLVEDCRV